MEGRDQHISSRFDADLKALEDLTQNMGSLVAGQLVHAVTAITRGDLEAAGRVLTRERRVNEFDMTGQEAGIQLLAVHHPLARDLRWVSCLTRVVSELERVGDEARKLAQMGQRRAIDSGGECPELFTGIPALAEEALLLLDRALRSLLKRDVELAVTVVQSDKRLDGLFQGALRRLATYLMQDPRNVGWTIDAVFALKALERVGDHAANMAEQLIYAVKGKDVRHIQAEHLSEGYLDQA